MRHPAPRYESRRRRLGTFGIGALVVALALLPESAPARAAGDIVGPKERPCFTVAGAPGDIAIVNLTPILATAAGDGQLISSDATSAPVASNVNYGPGTVDPNVALAPIGHDGMVCYANADITSVHLVADHLGSVDASVFIPATSSGVQRRRLDTRDAGTPVAAGGRVCFTVTGDPGDIAVVNLTPVLATAGGDGQLISSDVATPPTASNVNYGPGTVDPNVAFAPIGHDGKVCYANADITPVHLVADHLGSIEASAFTAATPSGTPQRRVDTRESGFILGPRSHACFTVAGDPGDVAIVNLTPILATASGHGQLISSDVTTPPEASNVNYGPGTVDPNVAFAPIGDDGKVCYANAHITSVHLVADHLGTIDASVFTPATKSGNQLRRLDTRLDHRPWVTVVIDVIAGDGGPLPQQPGIFFCEHTAEEPDRCLNDKYFDGVDTDGIIRVEVDVDYFYAVNAYMVNAPWPCGGAVGEDPDDLFHFGNEVRISGWDLLDGLTLTMDEPTLPCPGG